MDVLKGGRGKKAPYNTTHVRIPEAMKPAIEQAIAQFKELAISGKIDPNKPINKISQLSQHNKSLTSLEEATKIAQCILRQKQSAKKSVEKLLAALYNS